jgi:hypothetical protein
MVKILQPDNLITKGGRIMSEINDIYRELQQHIDKSMPVGL